MCTIIDWSPGNRCISLGRRRVRASILTGFVGLIFARLQCETLSPEVRDTLITRASVVGVALAWGPEGRMLWCRGQSLACSLRLAKRRSCGVRLIQRLRRTSQLQDSSLLNTPWANPPYTRPSARFFFDTIRHILLHCPYRFFLSLTRRLSGIPPLLQPPCLSAKACSISTSRTWKAPAQKWKPLPKHSLR